MDSESREITGLPRRLRLLAMTKGGMCFWAHDRTVAPDSLSKCHSGQMNISQVKCSSDPGSTKQKGRSVTRAAFGLALLTSAFLDQLLRTQQEARQCWQ